MENEHLDISGYMDPFEEAFESFPFQECVSVDACINFYLHDTKGNSICCDYGEGNYSLYYSGELQDTGGDFGSDHEITIGPCGAESTMAPTTPPQTNIKKLFKIEIFTDCYAEDVSYRVVDDKDPNFLMENEPFHEDYFYDWLFTFDHCIRETGCYTFMIFDSFGDGLCCSQGEGYYMLYYDDGEELVHGAGRGDFGSQASFTFF